MKLFEFEAKKMFTGYGIPVPRGDVATNPDEAEAIARKIGKPVVLKSQILVSGRGKAGGIQFADTPAEARKVASNLIGRTIKDSLVRSLLVEEKVNIAKQFYASMTVDRQAKTYVVLASTEGGVDIEQIAQSSPEKIARYWVDPIKGFGQVEALKLLGGLKLDKNDANQFASMLAILYKVLLDNDAELAELNPLVKLTSGEFMAADARIIIDDNAIFRHAEFKDRSLQREEDTPREAEARKQNLAYVDLDGDIGIVGNGAGLVMGTIDFVQLYGGKPGNFLDIGGGGDVDITKKGLLLVIAKPEVKKVLVNVLGGITRCDVVAEAVVQALKETTIRKPMVVRLIGTNEEEGAKILKQAGITSYREMDVAVQQVLKL